MEKFKYINDIPEFPACNSSQEHKELCAEYISAGAIPKSELVSGDWKKCIKISDDLGKHLGDDKEFEIAKYQLEI